METTRRLDLLVMEDHELRRLKDRFVVMRRIARDSGAAGEELERWSGMIAEIELEETFRRDESDDRILPF